MTRKFTFFFLALVALSYSLQALANEDDPNQPKIVFIKTAHDFGVAARQEVMTYLFSYSNAGKADLLVEKKSADCGCNVEILSPAHTPPDGQGTVKLTINTGKQTGRITKSVLIKTNDPENPQIKLVMTGLVQKALAVFPKSIYFANVVTGDTVSKTIKLIQLDQIPLHLERIETNTPFLSAHFIRHKNKNRNEYLITIKLRSATAPMGTFVELITLITNSRKHRKIDVPVMGEIIDRASSQARLIKKLTGSLSFLANLDGNWDVFFWKDFKDQPIRLTQTPYDEKSPTFSSDKQKLVYATTEGRLYIVDLSTLETEPLLIKNFVGKWDNCSFSPNGQQLVCTYLEPQQEDKTVLAVIERSFFALAYLTPLLIPPYMQAIVWGQLLAKNGAVNTFLITTLGFSEPPLNAYSLLGGIFVLGMAYFPFVTLLTISGLKNIDSRYEEAALLQSGPFRTLSRITLPLAMPHILSGAIFVFVFAIIDFGVADILRIKVFPIEIFIEFSALYNERAAVVLGLPLLLITMVLISL